MSKEFFGGLHSYLEGDHALISTTFFISLRDYIFNLTSHILPRILYEHDSIFRFPCLAFSFIVGLVDDAFYGNHVILGVCRKLL